MAPPIESLALLLSGTAASVLGSIVGLGGGFIAVPVLRLFFGFSPELAAATSLVLVFANTASATTTFVRRKRVAFDLAIPVVVAAIPGSVAGALLASHVSSQVFDLLYAAMLTLLAFDILRRAKGRDAAELAVRDIAGSRPSIGGWLGAGVLIGLVSSLFGIGGGVIAVPLLMYFTKRPLQAITATSTAIIALTAPVGIIVYALAHEIQWVPALTLGAGGLAGGVIGARLASRISSGQLSLLLAAAMLAAAAAMVLRHR